MLFDLHSHTTASDGELSPVELVRHARECGVDVLSITDHDTLAAYDEIDPAATGDLRIISGVEFSTTWKVHGIHVLGLNVDLASAALINAAKFQTDARRQRAERIAEKLKQAGLGVSLSRVEKIAGTNPPGRPHFASHLVELGLVKDTSQAFSKYLGQGKAGDVREHWASLEQIVEWIRASGGNAVLAHPGKYKMTRTKLRALVAEFGRVGGEAIEVVSGHQQATVTKDLALLCVDARLYASCGSDFHRRDQPWSALGRFPDLPQSVTPIWDLW